MDDTRLNFHHSWTPLIQIRSVILNSKTISLGYARQSTPAILNSCPLASVRFEFSGVQLQLHIHFIYCYGRFEVEVSITLRWSETSIWFSGLAPILYAQVNTRHLKSFWTSQTSMGSWLSTRARNWDQKKFFSMWHKCVYYFFATTPLKRNLDLGSHQSFVKLYSDQISCFCQSSYTVVDFLLSSYILGCIEGGAIHPIRNWKRPIAFCQFAKCRRIGTDPDDASPFVSSRKS